MNFSYGVKVFFLILSLFSVASESFAAPKATILPKVVTAPQSTTVADKKELYLEGVYPLYPQTTPGKTPEETSMIARGEYLAKMGDCIACHTDMKEKGQPYAGGLSLKTPFGVFYTPNITPDKETGIGNWTEADFIRAVKEGKDPKGRNYFPVFPYIYFSKITDDDAKALYAYFMHLPAVKQKNKPLRFPFGVPGARFSLLGWNLLFFYPNNDPIAYDASKSVEWNRGKYIVDGLGHCSMCHTPLNPLGAPKKRYYLTGGFIDGYWAPNITQKALHALTKEQVSSVFSQNMLLHQAGPVAGPMAEVNHNSLSKLSASDQEAIVDYLKTVVSEEPNSLDGENAQPTLHRGKQVYYKACVICHQNGVMSAPLLNDPHNWFNRIKMNGLLGLYRHAIHGYNSMPYRGACVTCSDNDIISAVDYMLNMSLTRAQWIDIKQGGVKKYPASGKAVYLENCAACHQDGLAGAPKVGDKAVWAPIIAKNMDTLIGNVLQGKTHAEHGGCKECSSEEVLEAIKYMVSQSKTSGNYTLW